MGRCGWWRRTNGLSPGPDSIHSCLGDDSAAISVVYQFRAHSWIQNIIRRYVSSGTLGRPMSGLKCAWNEVKNATPSSSGPKVVSRLTTRLGTRWISALSVVMLVIACSCTGSGPGEPTADASTASLGDSLRTVRIVDLE